MPDEMDKAGTRFWDERWKGQAIPVPLNPKSNSLANHVYRCYHNYFQRVFREQNTSGQSLIEIGCGRSKFLPYFAKEFGFNVTGIDYSEIGCQQTRTILERAGVDGNIVYADLFAPPENMLSSAKLTTAPLKLKKY